MPGSGKGEIVYKRCYSWSVREQRNYDVRIKLSSQEFNICSEALSSIFQMRRDICYRGVPPVNEEETQLPQLCPLNNIRQVG